ncbi:MAG: hypothetical protein ACKO2A_04970, partial [Acidimicrobiaceae bacterium]
SGTTLTTGDSVTLAVCFQGEVDRASGSSNADVKLILNSRASAGISWNGARSSNGGSNNCMTFAYTVLSTDTSQSLLSPTSLTLSNAATDRRTAAYKRKVAEQEKHQADRYHLLDYL